jgi:hypothetical protein
MKIWNSLIEYKALNCLNLYLNNNILTASVFQNILDKLE